MLWLRYRLGIRGRWLGFSWAIVGFGAYAMRTYVHNNGRRGGERGVLLVLSIVDVAA